METELKKISIRGRFAFCLACLHNAMQQEGISSQRLALVLERMSAFLNTNHLDDWEKKIVEVSPDTLFDDHPDNKFDDYETVSAAELLQLMSTYKDIPKNILELIDLSINVGLSNLYGGTGEYSPLTLDATAKVINLMISSGYPLPSLQEFASYSFNDNNGWG